VLEEGPRRERTRVPSLLDSTRLHRMGLGEPPLLGERWLVVGVELTPPLTEFPSPPSGPYRRVPTQTYAGTHSNVQERFCGEGSNVLAYQARHLCRRGMFVHVVIKNKPHQLPEAS
jgi:hypothetical protein